LGSATGANKENQDEKWVIFFASRIFDTKASLQKIYLRPEEARRAGVSSVVPVFVLDPPEVDPNSPFVVLPSAKVILSIPLSLSRSHPKLVVDSGGAVLSVVFKSSQNTVTQPLSLPLPSVFAASTHFHSLDDLKTLEEVFRKLDFEDSISISDWVPIVNKDSFLLLRELVEILFRCTTSYYSKDETEIVKRTSTLIVLCWEINGRQGISGEESLSLFHHLMNLFSSTLKLSDANYLEELVPVINLAKILARRSINLTSSTEDLETNRLVVSIACDRILATELSSPLTKCLIPFTATLWFRNLLSHTRATHDFCSGVCTSAELSQIAQSEHTSLSEIYGVRSEDFLIETLLTLTAPACSWMTNHLFQLTSDESSVRDPSDRFTTLRYLAVMVTLLLSIQQFVGSRISFTPRWDLIQQSLFFLMTYNGFCPLSSEAYSSRLSCMIQIVDFLSFVFLDFGWLRKKENSAQHRDTILQVLEECVESIDSLSGKDDDDMSPSQPSEEGVTLLHTPEFYSSKLITLLSRCYDLDNFQVSLKRHPRRKKESRRTK
jgi:hypothetical protein